MTPLFPSLISCTVLLHPRFPHFPPRAPGAAVMGPEQLLSTAPAAHNSPCSGMGFLHGMKSFSKTKMLKHGFSTGCGSFRNSPPAPVWAPPFILYPCVSCFSHLLPLLSHFRFLWSNTLLCSTESNTALIWV